MRRWSILGALVLLGLACGGGSGGEPLLEDRPPESPLTWGLLMSWLALSIGAGSAVLGIWVDRDRSRPVSFALLLSGLILAATMVGGLQGYLDEEGALQTRADLERMLDMVEDLASNSDDPALASLVQREGKARRPRARNQAQPPTEPSTPEAAPAPEEEAPAEAAAAEGEPAGGEVAPAEAGGEAQPGAVEAGGGAP